MNTEKMMEKVKAFLRDEEGLTMVEYAIAGGLVAAGAATAFTDLGAAISAHIAALIVWMG